MYVVVKNGLYYSGPKTVPGKALSTSEPDWAGKSDAILYHHPDEAQQVADAFGGKVCSL